LYKHASSRRRISDENPQEDEELWRLNLEAAGRVPPASTQFIERVKNALRSYPKLNDVDSANKLNKMGILDAIGRPWTYGSVKAFTEKFNRRK